MKLLRIVLSAALLLMASISFSQSTEGDVVADIPFAFVVAGRTLPSGHYVVSRLHDTLGIHDLHNQGVFVPTQSAQRLPGETATKIVFHRYGDTYFLSEVWTGGSVIGRAVFPSRAERDRAESGREREIAVLRVGK